MVGSNTNSETEMKQLVTRYIRAKDHHMPHLMKLTFLPGAVLTMHVNTDIIEFPSQVEGLPGITTTLVTNFHAQFENVYTFCISDSALAIDGQLRCRWFVGMTVAESGAFRLGSGDYHWAYNTDGHGTLRVQQLTIRIDDMVELPAEAASDYFTWFDSLPHPWISTADLSAAPSNSALNYKLLNSREYQ